MSNTITCRLHVAKEHYDKIVRKSIDDDGKERQIVDFQIIKPMPDSLNISCDCNNERDIYMYISEKCTIPYAQVNRSFEMNALTTPWSPPYGIVERLAHDRAKALIETENEEQIAASYEKGKALCDNWRNYSYSTWRQWALANWGCKWNAHTISIEDDLIVFTTPNNPPKGWLKKLAALGINFELTWSDDGGPTGEIHYQGNGIIETKR